MSVIAREGNVVTITPGQDLVSSMVPEFSGTGMMDSIGIGVIIATHNSMKKNGAALVIANASENIIKLFKSMRLDQHLTLDS